MNLVIIESPYAGNIELNVAYARAAMRDSLRHGEAPLASHLLYPGALDDNVPQERALGISAGFAWGQRGDLVAFYVDLGWSRGMREAHGFWESRRIPLEERTVEGWKPPVPTPTWVRARDGSIYRNPIVTFDGGHIGFAEGQPYLVLWAPAQQSPGVVLDLLFGKDGWGRGRWSVQETNATVPGLPGGAPQPASMLLFYLGRRIPAPSQHDGLERYSTRIREGSLLDFPADPRDAAEIV